MPQLNFRVFGFLCLTLGLCLTGCQTVHWSKGNWESNSFWKRKAKETKTEFSRPEKITTIWKDAVYEENGIPRTRGFGGRVYFYDSENRCVKVDGDLVVYSYDDTLTNGGHTNPDRKYVFKKEDLQKHYAKTDLGHSYNIWLPWDDFGGDRRDISLVTVFSNETEQVVCKGTLDRVLLPGRSKSETAKKGSASESLLAQEAKSQVRSIGGKGDVPSLNSTTIDVPDNGVIYKQSSVEATAPAMVFNELHERATELANKAAAEGNVVAGRKAPAVGEAASEIALTSGQEPQTDAATAKSKAELRASFGQPGSFR
jgi:hypothetical protein